MLILRLGKAFAIACLAAAPRMVSHRPRAVSAPRARRERVRPTYHHRNYTPYMDWSLDQLACRPREPRKIELEQETSLQHRCRSAYMRSGRAGRAGDRRRIAIAGCISRAPHNWGNTERSKVNRALGWFDGLSASVFLLNLRSSIDDLAVQTFDADDAVTGSMEVGEDAIKCHLLRVHLTR